MTDEQIPAPTIAATLLLALPWLNPFSYGPTPAVAQGLVVWFAAAVCWMVFTLSRLDLPARVRAVAVAWALAAVVSAAMGLLQYLGFADSLFPWVDYVEGGQAYANLRQRNQLATLLGIGLAALLWWQVRSAAADSKHPVSRSLIALCVLLLVAADAAGASRTGLLQLVLLVLLGFVWRRARATLLIALLGYVVAALVLPHLIALPPQQSGILSRIAEDPNSCGVRQALWSNVLHLIAQKPWLGWGWGELSYAHFITLYPGRRFCEIMGNAHDLPLHLAVELGLPIAVAVCGVLAWLVLRAKPWREQDATRQLAWSVLGVIGVHSLLEFPLWYGPFQLAAVLAVWLLWQTRTAKPAVVGTSIAAHSDQAGVRAIAAAAVLAAACGYIAWDYWRISQIYLPVADRYAAYRDDTLNNIRASWLFARQVKFAELGISPLTEENAAHINALAKEMLHFSPEAGVVQKLIDSAALLGQSEEVNYYAKRFQAAYPEEYAAWLGAKSSAGHKTP